jgi:hypothetical protein
VMRGASFAKLPLRPMPIVATAAAALAVASGAVAAAGPTATTTAAREVGITTTTLTGAINPNGQATTYAFQYGTTTQYPQETAVQSAGSGTSTVSVTVTLTGLQPGSTYHYRLIAVNANGSAAGADSSFKTAGLAPPKASPSVATTGAGTVSDAHDAVLGGTVGPSNSAVAYYFQIGAHQPYDLQTPVATRPASKVAAPVQAPVGGLQGNQVFHYRLVVVGEGGEVTAGADRTFTTARTLRLNPRAVEALASPSVQRTLPDVVTVSGKLVPPTGLNDPRACEGFVDVTFRARTIAIQMLRAGLQSDCRFTLSARFSNRRRLLGGRIAVHVLFPGNQLLHRLAAPVQMIQIG